MGGGKIAAPTNVGATKPAAANRSVIEPASASTFTKPIAPRQSAPMVSFAGNNS